MSRLRVLHANVVITLFLGAVSYSVRASDWVVPPLTPGGPYTLISGDTLLINGNLIGSAVTLSPNTKFTIADGGVMNYGVSPAITTTGGGGILTSIILQPQSTLNAGAGNSAIAVLNTDVTTISIQGTVTGNIAFTTPGTNTTSIYGGGSLTGTITGFTGVLNLDGVQPVTGIITGAAGSNATLNLGYTAPITFTLNNILANVPNIFMKNGSFTINQNITNVNVNFSNAEKGVVNLNAILNGTGTIDNYGQFKVGTAGNITGITSFTNHQGSSFTINSTAPLGLATIINNGVMHVNTAITPGTLTQGASSAAALYLNANLTATTNLINGNGTNNSQIVVAEGITVTAPNITNSTNSNLELLDTAIFSGNLINDGNLTINLLNKTTFVTLLACSGTIDLSNGTLTIISDLPVPVAGTPVVFTNAITSAAATAIALPKAIINQGSIFGNFTASVDTLTGTNLSLIYSRVALNNILQNDPDTLTTTLESMASVTPITGSQAVLVNLLENNSSTVEQFKQNLSKLTPMVTNKSVRELHRSGLKPVLIRIAELTGKQKLYSAGDVEAEVENNFWFRPLFSHVKQGQDFPSGLLAYRNNIYGASLGVDTKTVRSKHLIGLALNFTSSHIVDQNNSTAKTMNHQCIVYGKYNTDIGIYVDWLGSIGVSESKQNRQALDDLPAVAKVSWVQYSLRSSLGYQLFADYLFTIEPDISLQYTLLNNNDYSETGPSVTNLSVHPTNSNYLLGGVGMRTYLNLAKFNYNFYSSIFARADYTLIGKHLEATASFVNIAAPSFTTKITTNKIVYSVGASTAYHLGDFKAELVFNYDFTQNFRDQQYYLNLAYKF